MAEAQECTAGTVGPAGEEPCVACDTGRYQPLAGQSACMRANPGYFVDIQGSDKQFACVRGTYQPNEAAESCLWADEGHHVPDIIATEQLACEAGSFQPLVGQSACREAKPGFYVAGTQATTQTACLAGTFQDLPGQTTCLDAQPGYYVDSDAADKQLACSEGFFQPLSGETTCKPALPGFFVGATQAINQEACSAGSFQPNAGQSTCLEARPGFYVQEREATGQTACLEGDFQDRPGQTACNTARPGFYATVAPADNEFACSKGAFQPLSGQTRCNLADPGFFVGATQAIQPEACEAGRFQPESGQTACLEAKPGYYVPARMARRQTACDAGSYQDLSGQTTCKSAAPGYFVESAAAPDQAECLPGTYQPLGGQQLCNLADVGHFVDSRGSKTQQKCEIGTYQDSKGRTSCFSAEPGFFVAGVGATTAEQCPVGSVSYRESSACRSAPATGPDIVSPQFASNAGRGDPVRIDRVLTPLAVNPWTLNVRNLSRDLGFASPLTRLTLNSLAEKPSADGTIGIPAFTPGTTLDEGGAVDIGLVFKPDRLGWLNFGLEAQTDERAGLGLDGEVFHLDLNISADGSDVGIGVLADRPSVAIDDPFTVWVDASNPGNAPSNTNLVTVGLPAGVDCNWRAHPEGGAAGGSSALNAGNPQPVSLPSRARMLYQGTCRADETAAGPLVVSGTIEPDTLFDDLIAANNTDSTRVSMGAAEKGRTGVRVHMVEKTDFLAPRSQQKIEYELHNDGPDPIVGGKFTVMLLGAAKHVHGSSHSPRGEEAAGSGAGTDEGTPRQTSPLAQAIDFDYSLPVGQSLRYSLTVRSEFLESQRLRVIARASLSPGWIQENIEGSAVEFTVSGGLFADSFE